MNLVTLEQTLQDDKASVLDKMVEHEQVLFCNDKATGLQAIIAVHDTTMGPALGGCRMAPYQTMDLALKDVLRLSKGMTYKCAAADVDFGGGKSVIIGDPLKDKTPEKFRAFGQFIESLNGRFYTGTDMGTTLEDFVQAMKETNYIVGKPVEYGGGGDSSIPTALGVFYGIKATNQNLFGDDKVEGRKYSIQGLGKVGYKVAEHIINEGGNVIVTDINEQAIADIQQLGGNAVKVVSSEEIYSQQADIFVPCAFGGVINDDTLNVLKVRGISGSANNQLAESRHGELLREKGILYAPDYIVNGGGLIQVADELYGTNPARVLAKTENIYNSLLEVFNQAEQDHIPTATAADRMCEKRIADAKNRNSFFTQSNRPKWNFHQ
ncbi:leucine dehydrogenase [Sporosarcina sp. P3]|uniref:Glu/Leu/Phe/Val dehydrogenase dimerization domain-containing protein n=1 Tax=Sporosarcina sp. P3 TaxID=2048245 RepID=UPI000C1632E8|nr:Glu/Leu/Phe/Val dehydrogenase dimerization domain-containing protein [Sporosarcina sp. P3]PID21892.1 leucine dehydrogenase [Sporosarcina sp. P3]